jgi:hypothetical protein
MAKFLVTLLAPGAGGLAFDRRAGSAPIPWQRSGCPGKSRSKWTAWKAGKREAQWECWSSDVEALRT